MYLMSGSIVAVALFMQSAFAFLSPYISNEMMVNILFYVKEPYHGSVKLFIEFLELTARLVNNLSDAPRAQDNLSKLLTALSA